MRDEELPGPPERAAYFERLEYEFHVRAFGEQLARINFVPLEERKAEVGRMFDHARLHGVHHEKPALGVTI